MSYIELELEAKAIEELIEMLSALPARTNHLDDALLTLRDVYDNAAEKYWTTIWSGEQ